MSTAKRLEELAPADIADATGRYRPTAEQARVIDGAMAPTLVVAGAGAGKTETMAARVVYLVATGRARPGEILGLTFTRKAAQQLRRRIRERLEAFAASPACAGAEGAQIAELIRTEDPRISTYDSYAGDFVSAYGLYLPVEPDVSIMGPTDLFLLARSVVAEWPHRLEGLEVGVDTIAKRAIALAEQLAGHLLTTDDIRHDPDELGELITQLPNAKGEVDAANKTLRGWREIQARRRVLLDVVDEIDKRMDAEGAVTFGKQMSYAARLANDFEDVVAAERRITKVVLLDEYQDTGQSQRILLSKLFGGSDRPPLAVTAVGDPMQSIYGWRGATASNLTSFIHDFPNADGTPARQLNLSTSWRNPEQVLTLANGITADLRKTATDTPVPRLEPKPGAAPGQVRLALHDTETTERAWLAETMARTFRAIEAAEKDAPTAAVLVRRNEDAEPLARALREQGLEVEILASGGLLDVPEVADMLALVRVAADPGDDSAALRLLTGDRFRLGAADLAALSRRAGTLSHRRSTTDDGEITTIEDVRSVLAAMTGTEKIDAAGLAEAAADPGPDKDYTGAGREAIAAFHAAVAAVRERLDGGPAHALAIAEAQLGLDVETRLRALQGRGEGRQQLDALQSYAAAFAQQPDASVETFLEFLGHAREIENGLAQEVVPQPGRVQILTVHKAKGLEWRIVAVPHLVDGRFPAQKVPENWVNNEFEVPVHLRGDAVGPDTPGGVDVPDFTEAEDLKMLEAMIQDHRAQLKAGTLEEDTRLFYVAITRSEQHLLASGACWGTTKKPRLPSPFLSTLKNLVDNEPGLAEIDTWVDDPGEENPMFAETVTGTWPQSDEPDPAQRVAEQVREAAPLPVDITGDAPAAHLVDLAKAQVADAAAGAGADVLDPAIDTWIEEAVVHLRRAHGRRQAVVEVEIPARLTATQHVALERDPAGFAANVLRPMPQKPNRFARRGTSFHTWVEHYFDTAEQFLLADEDLPGAADPEGEEDSLRRLRQQFLQSHWAQREAVAVEVPFAIRIGGHTKVGKMDAVFRDPDGDGWIVVDWKTGAQPGAGMDPNSQTARKHRRDVALQLAIYRIAWARLLEEQTGRPVQLDRIRGAFHYIGSGEDVFPELLPGPEELAEEFTRRFAIPLDLPQGTAGPQEKIEAE